PGPGPDLAGIRAHLARTLPAYMIPAHLIPLDTFPLNTSGKIDRTALPPPAYQPAATLGTAPATFIETVLADIYATILGHDQISATDSFFDLGGSSLGVMRLVTQLGAALGVDLDVSAVFLAPAPQQLAAVLRDRYGFDDADLDADGSPLTTAAR
ncbi:MAG TPA: phosphopantetheine-binding protein, partial [Streptosporangiaceae bacterium]|nr:phosphopantetheine-binding protein [Streptosporangiaceae bacterium]